MAIESSPTGAPTGPLYPRSRRTPRGRLRVSELHEIYFEESGNPRGKPVVFLHGGPGGGTEPKYRRFFDPVALPDRPARPARLRQKHPPRLAGGQHDVAPGRRPRGAAPAPGDPALAGLRRFVGQQPWRWRTRSVTPGRGRSWSARDLPDAPARDRCSTSRARARFFPTPGSSTSRRFRPRSAGTCCPRSTRRLTSSNPEVQLAARGLGAPGREAPAASPGPHPDRPVCPRRLRPRLCQDRVPYFVNSGFFFRDEQLLEDVGMIRQIPG